MAVVLQRSTLYQFLFTACIIAPYFNKFELTFAVWTLSVFLTFSNTYSFHILKQIFSFVSILAISSIVMLYKSYDNYYILRDITYLSKPFLGLFIGYQLCKKIEKNIFRLVVNTGLILALYHFLLLFFAFVIHHARTVESIRLYAGYFSDYEVYALIVLLFSKKFELGFSKNKIYIYIILIAISSFLYLARTNFIQFIILYLAMKGYFVLNRKSLLVITSVFFISIIGYTSILYINPKRNGQGLEAFLYKIKVAPIEPFKTRIKRDDWKDFNDNYRSYETISTIRQVTRDGYESILFGQGIGSKVDLKQKIIFGDLQIRFVSILHNGFMTVFLKSGLFGVFLFCYSIFLLFKNRRSEIPIIKNINFLLLGSGIYMILSGWVFMGFYFAADTKSIIIGLLLCLREIEYKKQSNVLINQ